MVTVEVKSLTFFMVHISPIIKQFQRVGHTPLASDDSD